MPHNGSAFSLNGKAAFASRVVCAALRALAVVVVVLLSPIHTHASGAQTLTWDDLAPGGQSAQDLQQSMQNPHGAGDGGSSASPLPFADPFDPLNAGRLVIEDWGPEDHAVATDLIDTQATLDGYVLPLRWEGDRVVDFLLVPWVGACIHTPAPPPNQIVHVTYPDGLAINKEFEAIRLAGTLRHAPATHELYLVDGQRPVPASYALANAEPAGAPGDIVASSAKDLPILARVQLWAQSLFIGSMNAIGAERSSNALLTALVLAFGYGVFHTLGPGHGKSVVVSYFVGTGGSLGRGMTMGLRIAIIHVLSAIVVVFALDLAVRQTTGAAPSDYRAIRVASYGLIMLIGATMLWQAVAGAIASRKRRRDGQEADAACDHHSDHTETDRHSGCSACTVAQSAKGSGWIAASVGLVPCTGALLVMLYGLANDLVLPAILMVLAISGGMAIAMSAIGILAIWGRNLAERRIARTGAQVQYFEQGARLVGSTCVLAIGALLLMAALSSPPSAQGINERSAVMPLPANEPGG
ncbi:MAG: DUF3299 domain-containing protein [Pseudomonadota bacterium]